MYLKITNISFPAIENDRIEIPVDLQPVKDWLDDYNPDDERYGNISDEDAAEAYIRTAIFQIKDPVFEVEELLVDYIETPPNLHQDVCVDAFDHKHKIFREVQVSLKYPSVYIFKVRDDLLDTYKEHTGKELLHMLAYDLMNFELPIVVEISEL